LAEDGVEAGEVRLSSWGGGSACVGMGWVSPPRRNPSPLSRMIRPVLCRLKSRVCLRVFSTKRL
jgi:hypothetical protein